MRVASCVHTSSAFAIYAAFFFDPGGRPGPRRRLRRRRPFFAFGTRSARWATAFGGRPGPPGRHFPRRFRRRPVFALFPVETLPNNDWIAEPTSCCTISRTKVARLRCLGIYRLLSGGGYTKAGAGAKTLRPRIVCARLKAISESRGGSDCGR